VKLIEMRPHQCAAAREGNWPLFLPVGTIEYHGEHLPLGMDTICVLSALDELEKRIDCVLAPPLLYGPASYVVAGPERGTIDVDVDRFEKHVSDVLRGLLENGYGRIFIVIHHQFEGGRMMPTALACLKAGMSLTFEKLERERGRGWWGATEMREYYDTLQGAEDPFNRIRVVPLMSPSIQRRMGYDHAGKLETSLMMACAPDLVDMDRLAGDGNWFTKDAADGTPAHGRKTIEMIVDYLEEISR
jgi:creatinine amidohydrolase/Fe(II)-dependent formamide hydrolase-like protein